MSALSRRFVKTTTTTTVTKTENDGAVDSGEAKTVTVTKKKKSIDGTGTERKDSKQEEVSSYQRRQPYCGTRAISAVLGISRITRITNRSHEEPLFVDELLS